MERANCSRGIVLRFGLLFCLASLFVDTLIESFFFFFSYAKIARSVKLLMCHTFFFVLFLLDVFHHHDL